MTLAVNFSAHHQQLRQAYEQVRSGDAGVEWAVFGYSRGTNDLKVLETGQGLEELAEEFSDGKIQYAFARVIEPTSELPKLVLIGWCGMGVPVEKKGLFASHLNDVAAFLKGYHLQIHARTEADVTPSFIMKRISESTGAKYTSETAATLPTPSTKSSPAVTSNTYKPTTATVSNATPSYRQAATAASVVAVSSVGSAVHSNWNASEMTDIEARDQLLRQQEERREQERRELEQRELELKTARMRLVQEDASRREADFFAQQQKRRDSSEATRREAEMKARHERQALEQAEQKQRETELRERREAEMREQQDRAEEQERLRVQAQERQQREEREVAERREAEQRVKQAQEQARKREEEEKAQRAQEAREQAQQREAAEKAQREREAEQARLDAQRRQKEKEEQEAERARIEALEKQREAEELERKQQALREQQAKEVEEKKRQQAQVALDAAKNELSYQTASPAASAHKEQNAVALYAYDALQADEMNLCEGEHVIVTDKVDDDWWIGTGDGGKSGLFPASYVKLVEHAEPSVPLAAANHSQSTGFTVTAQFDYDGVEDDELTFKEDDTIVNVVAESEEWWRGVGPNGKSGLFPASYVERI